VLTCISYGYSGHAAWFTKDPFPCYFEDFVRVKLDHTALSFESDVTGVYSKIRMK